MLFTAVDRKIIRGLPETRKLKRVSSDGRTYLFGSPTIAEFQKAVAQRRKVVSRIKSSTP